MWETVNLFTKYYYFETFNIIDLYNKDCSTIYYKITIVTTRISDLQQCCHYLSKALVVSYKICTFQFLCECVFCYMFLLYSSCGFLIVLSHNSLSLIFRTEVEFSCQHGGDGWHLLAFVDLGHQSIRLKLCDTSGCFCENLHQTVCTVKLFA